MANPIILAAALSRLAKITCPNCGKVKTVEKKPVAYRVCPRCHKHFPDPLAARRR
jgi:hypothetical protein